MTNRRNFLRQTGVIIATTGSDLTGNVITSSQALSPQIRRLYGGAWFVIWLGIVSWCLDPNGLLTNHIAGL